MIRIGRFHVVRIEVSRGDLARAVVDRRFEVLSDRERIVLKDIERELGANDPELARRLSEEAAETESKLWRFWLAGGVVAMLLLISLGADLPVLTLLLGLAAIGVAATGYRRWRKHGTG